MMGGLGNAALLAAIALVPIVVLMMTSFVKISVVLSLLRNALGAPDAPSGLIVMGLSLILTFFVMAPVALDMVHAAAEAPATQAGASAGSGASAGTGASAGAGASAGSGDAAKPMDIEGAVRELVPAQYRPQVDAMARGLGPLRGFLARHAAAKDKETFAGLAKQMGRQVQGDELWVLAPAFVATELREAFAIAVLIFVPFLVIDL
ncbi:MAG: EscR/YscR/HrcR family type III secretion system export apparatus protein, partial [Lysobacter sp.]|nr:EscR/YscR/HrcR family type III secretion system export apparatus protein [Lysobacter sp.]